MTKNATNLISPTEINDTDLDNAITQAKALAAGSHATSTLRKYQSDWEAFTRWCVSAARHSTQIQPLPTNDLTLAAYLGSMELTPPGTVKGRVTAIRFAHKRAGLDSHIAHTPFFDAAYRGYLRKWAGQGKSQQQPATEERLKLMVDSWDSGIVALRNRALLLLGFDAALRRSEISAMNVEHLTWTATKLEIFIPKAKGDQFGSGEGVQVYARQKPTYCPVNSLQRWLEVAAINEGAVFRRFHRSGSQYQVGDRLSERSVYNVVKDSAEKASLQGSYGAHSLRRGYINSAIDQCDSPKDVQLHVRHRSLEATSRYIDRRINARAMAQRLLR